MRLGLVLLLMASTPPVAAAEPFRISGAAVEPGTGDKVIAEFFPLLQGQGLGPTMEADLNSTLGNLAGQLTTQINSSLNGLQAPRFMRYMSEAAAATGKQMAIDYATDASIFSLSAGAGAAVANPTQALLKDPASFVSSFDSELPAAGASANASVLLGLNLRHLHLPQFRYFDFGRLNLFVNFATFSHTITNSALSSPAALRYMTLGVHAQYRIVEQYSIVRGGLLRWGGVSVATGFDFSSIGLTLSSTLPNGSVAGDFQQAGKTLKTELGWGGSANLAIDLGAASIPIEVYTNIQLAYFLTLFAGVALDFNVGSSSFVANADSGQNITVTLSDPTTGSTMQVANPTAELDFEARGVPQVVNGRGLFGLQVNMGVLAVFAQANIDTARNVGANAGVRIFW